MKNLFKNSKLIIATLGLSCIAIGSAIAQDNERKTHIGVKGGLMITNFAQVGEEMTDNNLKLGGTAGLFAKIPVLGFFSIQPELLYMSKGSSTKYQFGSGTITPGVGALDFNLNYLELPLLAVININKYVNIHAGPYAAFLLSANVKNKSQNAAFNSYDELNADNFQRIDYGISGGVGLDLKPVIAGVRYDGSLRSLGKSGVNGYLTQDARNSAFQIYIGLGF